MDFGNHAFNEVFVKAEENTTILSATVTACAATGLATFTSPARARRACTFASFRRSCSTMCMRRAFVAPGTDARVENVRLRLCRGVVSRLTPGSDTHPARL